MPCRSMAALGAALVCLGLLVPVPVCSAGWWHRHHGCSSGGSYASAVPGYSPAAAPASAPAPAPVYYYNQYLSAPAQAAPQAFVGQVREAFELIKMIRELRDELLPTDRLKPSPETETRPPDLKEIQAALDQLKAGQDDIRGRLINNAGIGQAIGEKLVEVGGAVSRLEARPDRQTEILSKLDSILEKIPRP